MGSWYIVYYIYNVTYINYQGPGITRLPAAVLADLILIAIII